MVRNSVGGFVGRLFGTVGNERENRPEDVQQVKRAMSRLGYYEEPRHGLNRYLERALDEGIRAYQKTNGLRVDGWMAPDGPTHRRLVADLTEVLRPDPGSPPVPKLKETRRPPRLIAPGELRIEDGWGEGRFGAMRGSRSHEGVDFMVDPGSKVKSTVTGTVTGIGLVYGKPRDPSRPEPTYRYVEVMTPDRFATRHFYLDPAVKVGDRVTAGSTILGTVQDLTKRYDHRMTNHVHVEMRDVAIPPLRDPSRSGFRRHKPIDLTGLY